MKLKSLGRKGSLMRQVLHAEFDNQYDMAMTFVRMQEWYESPKFHHKNFTLEEFMRWYSKEYGKGAFTYPKDWGGFNVPSTAVLAVMNGPVVPCGWEETWSNVEEKLFHALVDWGFIIEPETARRIRHALGRDEDWQLYKAPHPFYLIATVKGADPSDLKHEAAHGLFSVCPEYRREVLKAVRQFDTSPLANFLLKLGYSKWTLEDEVHAYALTGWPKQEGWPAFKPTTALKALRLALKGIEAHYAK